MALLPHTPHVPTRRSDPDNAVHVANAKSVRTMALTMLRSWNSRHAQVLTQNNLAAVACCEKHIIWYELFLASLDNGSPQAAPDKGSPDTP